MDEFGIVKSVSGALAVVSVERKSACDSCSAGCRVTDAGAEIEAFNQAKAAVGQKVKVSMKPYSYLKGSILVYGIPALALIAGAVAGKEFLAGSFKSTDPEIVSAVCAFGAFILSFAVVKLLISRMEKKTAYKPVIDEIIKEG